MNTMSPYSVRMRENMYQSNSEYGHFWRSTSEERFRMKLMKIIKNILNIVKHSIFEVCHEKLDKLV